MKSRAWSSYRGPTRAQLDAALAVQAPADRRMQCPHCSHMTLIEDAAGFRPTVCSNRRCGQPLQLPLFDPPV